MQPTVFVLGSFVVDCAYRARCMPAAGETVLGSSFVLGPGGKGSNQAVAAARAGAQVALQTAVGRDVLGDIGRSLWRDEGVDTSWVKMTDTATGSAAILLDEVSGANRIVVVPGACGTVSGSDVDAAAAVIQSAKVLVVQLELPLEAVMRGLALAHAAGVTTVLNPAPAPLEPLPSELLQYVDYLIPNESEAASLTGVNVDSDSAVEEAAKRLQAAGASQVIVTLGERGALHLGQRGELTRVPAFALGHVQDTTGAGDALCGAFAAALAEGADAGKALRFASAAAGLAVLRHGAAQSMPRRQEIDAVLLNNLDA